MVSIDGTRPGGEWHQWQVMAGLVPRGAPEPFGNNELLSNDL
jgi:hypothetical protein